jgi:hypothetical protein
MARNTDTPKVTYRLTREDWLHRAIDTISPMFEQVGFPLPEKLHVSVGFGGSGAGKYERFVEGVTWHTSVSSDAVNHIFISPSVDDTAHVLEVLIHELGHAALNNEDGHRGRFAEMMTRLGMSGPFTSATADIEMTAELMVIAHELGEYPHGKLTLPAPVSAKDRKDAPIPVGGGRVSSGPKAQTNRWVSVTCPHHGGSVRLSRTAMGNGAPLCGHDDEAGMPCGTRMIEK